MGIVVRTMRFNTGLDLIKLSLKACLAGREWPTLFITKLEEGGGNKNLPMKKTKAVLKKPITTKMKK